jgi:hypothetical protein
MNKKNYILFFLFAILNTVFIATVPAYFYSYLVILFLGAAIFGAIIVMDILGKTHLWMSALYVLALGILSLVIGMFFIDF